jgi:phosphatidylinositol phospholipase C delta
MPSDRPLELEAFLAAARGAIAHLHLHLHLHLPIVHTAGSNSSRPNPDCLLHLHVVVTNFLHRPLRSLARCFRGDDAKPKRPLRDRDRDRSAAAGPQQQLELLLCVAFDAFDACEHNSSQLNHLQLLRKVIDGKRADFDGFLSNLGFAKVGAPPPRPSAVVVGAAPAPAAPVSDQEEASGGIGDSEGVDSATGSPQKSPARLLTIPLSNVERLRSTLSAVSLTELIELVPQLVSRSSASPDGHPDKKKLFSVQDFFRYAEIEGNIVFHFSTGRCPLYHNSFSN